MRSVRILLSTTMTVIGFLGMAQGPASAANPDNLIPTANYDHWRTGGTTCKTDNATVTYYMDSGGTNALEAGDKQMVRDVIASEYQPTNLSVTHDSTPTFSGGAETDWYLTEGSVSGDSNGSTFCNDPDLLTYKCDQHHIKIESGSWTAGMLCHELGHGVGFVHGDRASPRLSLTDGDNGCMRTPVGPWVFLDNNQITRINNNY